MRLVIDADAAIRLAEQGAFERIAADRTLCAPRLLWSECCSVLHRLQARNGGFHGPAHETFERILAAPIELIDGYARRAPWDIASLLGWHKTYDAEYLAAARHVGASIFTLDQQLSAGARRLGVATIVPD